VIVSLPTSTGKTLLGELFAVHAMGAAPGVVCFVTPYVATGRQVVQAFRRHWPSESRIHAMLGGFAEPEGLAPTARMEIVVATPERLEQVTLCA